MAKPTDLPVHATDTNYPADAAPEAGTPIKVEPVAGKQQLGHRPGEKPPAQSENWWKNLVYQWCSYVNSGALEGPITIEGDLTVEGTFTAEVDSEFLGVVSMDDDLFVVGEVNAADYNHDEYRATLPVRFDSANTAMGMSADVPRMIVSTAGIFHYYTPPFSSVGIRRGDRITKVRARYSGNGTASTMSLRVVHYRYDTGTAETATSSTATSNHLEVVPGSGKNELEEHDTMLDVMYAIFEGSASGVTLEGIDVFWIHPA